MSAEGFIGEVKVAGYPVSRREHHFGTANVLLPSGVEYPPYECKVDWET